MLDPSAKDKDSKRRKLENFLKTVVISLIGESLQQRHNALPTVLGRKIGHLVGRPRYNIE